MRVMVLGGDGYLGWPTALHLSARGDEVHVVDNLARRGYDVELGTESLVPILPLDQRLALWRKVAGLNVTYSVDDLCDYARLRHAVATFRPDAIVHFGEQRSAPYSMIDREHAVYTQTNNVVGNLNVAFAIAELDPSIHLVKLGTMGEYGTPNIDIEEGWLDVEHNGRKDRLPFPKQPGSFYHLSKCHDSANLLFCARTWGLAVTDLNQGVVYGQATPETSADPGLATRFDYDQVFGTVLNRFVVQHVAGVPLTVYGSGYQTRGFLNINDTLACVALALDHPADRGDFRVFNQFTEQFSVGDLASTVCRVLGASRVEYLDPPRVEAQAHHYEAKHTALADLGLVAHLLDYDVIERLARMVQRHAERIDLDVMAPTINWRSAARGLEPA